MADHDVTSQLSSLLKPIAETLGSRVELDERQHVAVRGAVTAAAFAGFRLGVAETVGIARDRLVEEGLDPDLINVHLDGAWHDPWPGSQPDHGDSQSR